MDNLVKSRHMALQDEQQQQLQARSMNLIQLAQSHSDKRIPTALFRATASAFAPAGTPPLSTSPRTMSSLTSISPQGIRRILGLYADCSVILLDRQLVKMEQVRSLFKRESWISPWIQHWRLQDELTWASRLAECSPQMLLTHEDMFLNIWFSTISLPVQEMTVQHRLLRALLNMVDYLGSGTIEQVGSSSLYRPLLKDMPIAHRDYRKTDAIQASSLLCDTSVDQSFMDAEQDSKLLQEFKESRLQILAKVLSNIGEYYLAIRPANGSSEQKAFYVAHAVKSRLQSYLGLLLNQIKKDYERLESRQMVRENLKHIELAHHVVGHCIQHCGLVLQSSQLAGPHDSVLNYLTSSRSFPQPRMDGVYVYQKIRGYAYLYQAGEKQFFRDMLEIVMTYLQVLRGIDGFHSESHAASVQGSCLGIQVVDGGTTVYGDAIGDELRSVSDNSERNLSTFHEKGNETIPRHLYRRLDETNIAVRNHGDSSVAVAQGKTGLSIQTLFAKQTSKQQTPQERSDEALWILTSSLRNTAIESEDRRHWNTVMSSFRTMTFASIFRPLLTAFLGMDGERGYCASSLLALAAGGTAQHLPQRPSLIMAAVPATRWLISVVEALRGDIDALDSLNLNFKESDVLRAYEGFQKETSTLFCPLLQCLAGSIDLVSSGYLDRTRTRLGDLTVRENRALADSEQLSEDERNATRALHLSGQSLRAIAAIVKVARKIQAEHVSFYDRNMGWRESLLGLAEFAFDRSFDVMMALGGPVQNVPDPAENGFVNTEGGEEQLLRPSLLEGEQVSWTGQDRLSSVQDAVALESSFQEYVSAQTQSVRFAETVYRQLVNAPSFEGWACDIFADGFWCVGSAPTAQQQQQQPHPQIPMGHGLKRHHWALWNFQSSFLGFCHVISTLDPGLHQKVQRALGALLRPPLVTQPEVRVPLYRLQKWDSIWYHNLHHAAGSTESSMDRLRRCLSREWRLFLAEQGMWWGEIASENESRTVDIEAPSTLFAPGISALFV
ncbi:hypothetical protein BGX28_005994 [Mortierella sp. GBA30]|nr:hypothetical protein BGX28_005994 [Mortierella sp. GBA30]